MGWILARTLHEVLLRPGEGALELALPVALGTPSLSVARQAVVQDPGLAGLVFSNGLELTIPAR